MLDRGQSSLFLSQHTSTRQDPTNFFFIWIHSEVRLEDESTLWSKENTSADTRRKHWTPEHGLPTHRTFEDSEDIADRHYGMQFLHLALCGVALVVSFSVFPTGAFQEQPVYIDTLWRTTTNLCSVTNVVETTPIRHEIQRLHVLS